LAPFTCERQAARVGPAAGALASGALALTQEFLPGGGRPARRPAGAARQGTEGGRWRGVWPLSGTGQVGPGAHPPEGVGPGHGNGWVWACHGRFGHGGRMDALDRGGGSQRPPGGMPAAGGRLVPAARGCAPGRMEWGWARADPGFLGDGSGPAEAQTEDRGWSRFGSAGPDGDSGLIWRAHVEDHPRSAPDRSNLTRFRYPCPGGSPNGPAPSLSRRLVRAVGGKGADGCGCRVAHHIRCETRICRDSSIDSLRIRSWVCSLEE